MQTDTVGQPIFFLDTGAQPSAIGIDPDPRSAFQASASEAFGQEAAEILADRIDNLMRKGSGSSRPIVLACVRGETFEVAIISEDGAKIISTPIDDLEGSPFGLVEVMIDAISIVVHASGGITDMLVNQILCRACSDPLTALLRDGEQAG